jgi:hypothetical protein
MRVSEEGEPSRCRAFRVCRPPGLVFQEDLLPWPATERAEPVATTRGAPYLPPASGSVASGGGRQPERRGETEPRVGVGRPTMSLEAPDSVALTPSPSGSEHHRSPSTFRPLRGRPEDGRAARTQAGNAGLRGKSHSAAPNLPLRGPAKPGRAAPGVANPQPTSIRSCSKPQPAAALRTLTSVPLPPSRTRT